MNDSIHESEDKVHISTIKSSITPNKANAGIQRLQLTNICLDAVCLRIIKFPHHWDFLDFSAIPTLDGIPKITTLDGIPKIPTLAGMQKIRPV